MKSPTIAVTSELAQEGNRQRNQPRFAIAEVHANADCARTESHRVTFHDDFRLVQHRRLDELAVDGRPALDGIDDPGEPVMDAVLVDLVEHEGGRVA